MDYEAILAQVLELLQAHCHLGLGTLMPRSASESRPVLNSPLPSTCTVPWT